MSRPKGCASTSPATASAASRQRCSTGCNRSACANMSASARADQVKDFRARWIKQGEAIAGQLGLAYRIEQASDPFFGRGGKLMAMSQVEQALKFELVVPIHSNERPTACMSFNYHRDHFGAAWNLQQRRGRDGGNRLRRFRHRSAGAGAVRHPRRRACAMAGARAPGARGLISFRSDAQNRVFGISEIAEPRALRALEIFRLAAAAENADEPRNGAVGVDDDDGAAVPGERCVRAGRRSGRSRRCRGNRSAARRE